MPISFPWMRPCRAAQGLLALGLALMLGACQNPVGYQTDHVEAAEVVLTDADGALLAQTDQNSRWFGPALDGEGALVLAPEVPRDVRVRFLGLDGRAFSLDGRPGHRLRAAFEPEGVALGEPAAGGLRLVGLRPGDTGLRVLIWHGDHPDFRSPPLPVRVRP